MEDCRSGVVEDARHIALTLAIMVAHILETTCIVPAMASGCIWKAHVIVRVGKLTAPIN